ncbi:MAG: hypothetical protein E7354_03980 [Clostridiales bacterium]|nr:hypothetical protein [Clostridiales bacterium]
MEKKNSKGSIKKMSAKSEEVTEKLEKLTGINLREEDTIAEEKPAENSETTTQNATEQPSTLQDIKDVDLGEDNAMKPLLFKCPNDIYHSIRKDSGETIVDESCCTVLSIMVKNTGEIATNFSGSHNPDLVKVLSKAVKKYMRELRRKLRSDYKIAREELKLKDEDIPEDMKFDATKEVQTERPWNKVEEGKEDKTQEEKPNTSEVGEDSATIKKTPAPKKKTSAKTSTTSKKK